MKEPTNKEIDDVLESLFSVTDEDVFLEWCNENTHELQEIVRSVFGDVKIFKQKEQ